MYSLEGFSSFEVADTCDEFSSNVLVVSHADFDRGEDAQFFSGDEMHVLYEWISTPGSSRMG